MGKRSIIRKLNKITDVTYGTRTHLLSKQAQSMIVKLNRDEYESFMIELFDLEIALTNMISTSLGGSSYIENLILLEKIKNDKFIRDSLTYEVYDRLKLKIYEMYDESKFTHNGYVSDRDGYIPYRIKQLSKRGLIEFDDEQLDTKYQKIELLYDAVVKDYAKKSKSTFRNVVSYYENPIQEIAHKYIMDDIINIKMLYQIHKDRLKEDIEEENTK